MATENINKTWQPLLGTAVRPILKLWCMWNERYAGQGSFSSCLTASVGEEIVVCQTVGFSDYYFPCLFLLESTFRNLIYTSAGFREKSLAYFAQISQALRF